MALLLFFMKIVFITYGLFSLMLGTHTVSIVEEISDVFLKIVDHSNEM